MVINSNVDNLSIIQWFPVAEFKNIPSTMFFIGKLEKWQQYQFIHNHAKSEIIF